MRICVNKVALQDCKDPLKITDNSYDELSRRFENMNRDNLERDELCLVKAVDSALALYEKDNHQRQDGFKFVLAKCHQLLNLGRTYNLSADYLFECGTAHKFKGAEYDHVLLEEGFAAIFDSTGNINEKLTEEELYVMFVAATRARRNLYLPSSMMKDLRALEERYEHLLEPTSDDGHESITDMELTQPVSPSADTDAVHQRKRHRAE